MPQNYYTKFEVEIIASKKKRFLSLSYRFPACCLFVTLVPPISNALATALHRTFYERETVGNAHTRGRSAERKSVKQTTQKAVSPKTHFLCDFSVKQDSASIKYNIRRELLQTLQALYNLVGAFNRQIFLRTKTFFRFNSSMPLGSTLGRMSKQNNLYIREALIQPTLH